LELTLTTKIDPTLAKSSFKMLARTITPIAIMWIGVALAILGSLPSWNLGFLVPADTFWLLHAGERFLAGDKLYVDVIETNPPMSILLYIPTLLVASMTGFSAQWLVLWQTIAVACLTVVLCAAVLRRDSRLDDAMRRHWLVLIAVVILFVPNASFTQREHYGLMLLLPYIFLVWRRASGAAELSLRLRLLIGLLAGLAVCIKPHFLLVPVFSAITCAFILRSWRPVFTTENWTGLGILVFYAGAALVAFPQFFGAIWPLLTDVYLQAKKPLYEFVLISPSSRLWLILAAIFAYVAFRMSNRREAAVFFAALIAFTIAIWVQGKGFAYHFYPASALAMITMAGVVLLRRITDRIVALIVAGLTAISLFSSTMQQRELFQAPGLLTFLQAAPPGRTLVTVSSSMEATIGVLRQTKLKWASRLHLRWITVDAETVITNGVDSDHRRKLEAYIAQDRTILAEDLTRKPSFIVFDQYGRDWEVWARADSSISTLLDSAYAPAAKTDNGRYTIYALKH
jgi:uncharacterized membrane protein